MRPAAGLGQSDTTRRQSIPLVVACYPWLDPDPEPGCQLRVPTILLDIGKCSGSLVHLNKTHVRCLSIPIFPAVRDREMGV